MASDPTEGAAMDPEDLLTVEEVARELRISRRTVYTLVHREELAPPMHIGGRSFWKRRDLEAAKGGRRGLRRRRSDTQEPPAEA